MFEISVGAHSCAMHSRLKAAPSIIIYGREMPRFSWVRIKQIIQENHPPLCFWVEDTVTVAGVKEKVPALGRKPTGVRIVLLSGMDRCYD